jgi:2-polyprenyl-3-methyl-5-hydroxy-6-metoxy-1,4-benzoquinol methylase
MSLVTTERQTYEHMWALSAYSENSPGETWLPLFLDMARPSVNAFVLDAGCGSGKGALALRAAGCRVMLCDLTEAGLLPETAGLPFLKAVLWDDLRPFFDIATEGHGFDYVYCCDVLEHIPTPFTMLVISRLLEAAPKVFLSISLMPDQFGVWVGKPLHQTVQTFPQWRDQLNTLGRVVEARDLLHTGVYLVERH